MKVERHWFWFIKFYWMSTMRVVANSNINMCRFMRQCIVKFDKEFQVLEGGTRSQPLLLVLLDHGPQLVLGKMQRLGWGPSRAARQCQPAARRPRRQVLRRQLLLHRQRSCSSQHRQLLLLLPGPGREGGGGPLKQCLLLMQGLLLVMGGVLRRGQQRLRPLQTASRG